MSTVKYGPCGNKLFSEVISILNEITGEKWGFVQWRRKISYVTCTPVGMKIGIVGTKNLHYHIKTRPNQPGWKQSLRNELITALVIYSRENPNVKIASGISEINDECYDNFSPADCKEFNAYQSTFIHAPTDWIASETVVLDSSKVLSRDDYM